MKTQEIKEYISNILRQEDKSNENILRKVIFSCSEVNWDKVEKIIKQEHPETNVK